MSRQPDPLFAAVLKAIQAGLTQDEIVKLYRHRGTRDG